jgi:uncharacterized membrane protein
MPSKYDTNPLDPDFPEKARAAAAASEETQTLPYRGGETKHFPQKSATTEEQQTRRFAEPDVNAYSAPNPQAYSQPYDGQYVPLPYAQHGFVAPDQAKKRKVDSLGIPENIAIAAAYFPWYPGLVAGFILLLLTPKSEPKVRFHAAQGLAAHIGIVLVNILLGAVTSVTGGDLGTMLFSFAAVVMMAIFTIKALKGKPIHIAAIEDLTNWLEEKLGPVK